MTLLEAQEIFAYWQESPPIHLAFKGFVGGFGAKPATAPAQDWRQALGDPQARAAATGDQLGEWRAVRGLSVVVGGNPHAGLKAPVLDLAELAAKNAAAAERIRRRHVG